MRLFALPLAIAKVGEDRGLAVNHRGIGGKDQIGQPGHRRQAGNRHVQLFQQAAQVLPLPFGQPVIAGMVGSLIQGLISYWMA